MRITVKLHGWMDVGVPGGTRTLEVPARTTPIAVLDLLGLRAGACLFVVNGEQASYCGELHDGDRLEIAHMAAGG